jgi:hypothetical protein
MGDDMREDKVTIMGDFRGFGAIGPVPFDPSLTGVMGTNRPEDQHPKTYLGTSRPPVDIMQGTIGSYEGLSSHLSGYNYNSKAEEAIIMGMQSIPGSSIPAEVFSPVDPRAEALVRQLSAIKSDEANKTLGWRYIALFLLGAIVGFALNYAVR